MSHFCCIFLKSPKGVSINRLADPESRYIDANEPIG